MEKSRMISFLGKHNRTMFSDGTLVNVGCQTHPPDKMKRMIKKKYKPSFLFRLIDPSYYNHRLDMYNEYIKAVDEIVSPDYSFDPNRVNWRDYETNINIIKYHLDAFDMGRSSLTMYGHLSNLLDCHPDKFKLPDERHIGYTLFLEIKEKRPDLIPHISLKLRERYYEIWLKDNSPPKRDKRKRRKKKSKKNK